MQMKSTIRKTMILRLFSYFVCYDLETVEVFDYSVSNSGFDVPKMFQVFNVTKMCIITKVMSETCCRVH